MENDSSARDGSIAIVGLGGLFPKASTVEEFWENVILGRDCVEEIPPNPNDDFTGFWRIEDHHDPDPMVRDKTYSKAAGFIPSTVFDPVEFSIPPAAVESISAIQLLGLVAARQALVDADLVKAPAALREKTSVILGVSSVGNTIYPLTTRLDAPHWVKILRNSGMTEERARMLADKLLTFYPEWNEQSLPGMLANVVAGRIASQFDLGGMSCVVDAACAASLAAVKIACFELTSGSSDVVLTGGVGVDLSLIPYVAFSKTPALSRSGASRPFDVDADGITLGDGIGILVLKRLADANRDKNRVYAVLKGVGSSSDGHGKSIYAPRFEGQRRALERAYQNAGVAPSRIQLVEAHGTGTTTGDQCEFKALSHVYGQAGATRQSVALGSVKSQIGHLRAAAGAASLVKTALALHQKILPPTIHVNKPNPAFEFEKSPFYLNTKVRPWIRPPGGEPRRAAVSSMGFGGANYHAILEEADRELTAPGRMADRSRIAILSAPTPALLAAQCAELAKVVSETKGPSDLRTVLDPFQERKIDPSHARVGFVFSSPTEARDLLLRIAAGIPADNAACREIAPGLPYREKQPSPEVKAAVLFPGQNSQYIRMGCELACLYPELREAFALMDGALVDQGLEPVSSIVFPPPSFDPDTARQQIERLTRTEFAQAAVGAMSLGLSRILFKAGFSPHFAIGHSFGELTALWAAGVLDEAGYLDLVVQRGKAMSLAGKSSVRSEMLAVRLSAEEVRERLAGRENVWITNSNTPGQTVVGGLAKAIDSLREELSAAGIKTVLLSVSAAFHTPLMKEAVAPFRQALGKVIFGRASFPIYSNVEAACYPEAPDTIRKLLVRQLVEPVRFLQSVEAAHRDGVRVFVEIGPKAILANLIREILGENEVEVVAVDPGSGPEAAVTFKRTIARLVVLGMVTAPIDPYGRPCVSDPARKSSVSIELNGGTYLNPRTLAARQGVLKTRSAPENEMPRSEAPTRVSSSLWGREEPRSARGVGLGQSPNSQDNPLGEPQRQESVAIRKRSSEPCMSSPDRVETRRGRLEAPACRETDDMNDQTDARVLLANVHHEFHLNQAKHVELISSLVEKQALLLERFGQSGDLGKVIDLLDRTLGLVEKNLEAYAHAHDGYLQNQLALIELAEGSGENARPVRAPAQRSAVRATANLGREARLEHPPTKPAPRPSSSPSQWTAPPAEEPVRPGLVSVELSTSSGRTGAGDRPVSTAPGASPAKPLDFEALGQRLVAIVSEMTGYPADVLNLDMDVEADLGIDSIKRVQILVALAKEYPDLNVEVEQTDEIRTLRQALEAIKKKS